MSTGLEGFVMLLRWLRVDIKGPYGVMREPPKWFQWGFIWKGDCDPVTRVEYPRKWYILVRLPSYLMKIPAWHDPTFGEPIWHQRCALFKERVPAGRGGWEEIEMACER